MSHVAIPRCQALDIKHFSPRVPPSQATSPLEFELARSYRTQKQVLSAYRISVGWADLSSFSKKAKRKARWSYYTSSKRGRFAVFFLRKQGVRPKMPQEDPALLIFLEYMPSGSIKAVPSFVHQSVVNQRPHWHRW